MNPIIRAMLDKVGGQSLKPGAWAPKSPASPNLLTQAWQSLSDSPESLGLKETFPNPQDRLNDAFKQLGASQPPAAAQASPAQASPMDRIAAAFNAARGASPMIPGDMGGYSPQQVPTIPPAAAQGPGAAPAAQASNEPDPIGFFMRNALTQRDLESGKYLNEAEAQQAMNSPFKGLFG